MDKDKFAAFLSLLVPQIVALIMREEGLAADEAIGRLYDSLLYERLEEEATKLWHLSAPTLYALLAEEMATGAISWPEEA